jgi:hypothetical protein
MTAAYRTRDQRVADDYLGSFAACSKCRQPTEHSELATFGAQCRPCFATYCAEANSDAPPPRTPAERRAVLQRLERSAGGISRNHAAERVKALRNLEASGKQLGGAQLWVLACCEQKLGIGPAIPEDVPA